MKKLILFLISIIASTSSFPYAYLPDDMSLSDALIVIAHNSPQAKAYNWRYYQQLGTLQEQWKAGARGGKINLHWRRPISPQTQLLLKAIETAEKKLRAIEKEIRNKKRDIARSKGLTKIWYKTQLRTLQSGRTGAQLLVTQAKKALGKLPEPFIGLCHEPDGASNCFLSATIQKSGEIEKAEDFFRTFAQLMEKNPNDIAIIILEDYLNKRSKSNGALGYSDQQIYEKLHTALNKSGLAKFAYKLDDEQYLAHRLTAENWPTIGQLRKSGKRLIIFDSVSGNTGTSPILNPTQDYPVRRTQWSFDWKKNLEEGICKMRDDFPGSKGFLVDHGPENTIRQGTTLGMAVGTFEGVLSKIPGVKIEAVDYKYLNSRDVLRKRLEQCSKASPGTPPNILNLDYVEIAPKNEPIFETIKEINKERAEQQGLSLKE